MRLKSRNVMAGISFTAFVAFYVIPGGLPSVARGYLPNVFRGIECVTGS